MARNTYIPSVLRPDGKKRIREPARLCRANPRSLVNAAYFGWAAVEGLKWWAVQPGGLENVNP